ncbi:MAG: phosphoribosylaminoimidazolesuccinocarboxamide synthase [Pseudomonadota bacterium]
MTQALLHTALELPNRRSGKVRDLYDVPDVDGADALLIVATDRVSAFDVVMANGMPGKGKVLTQLARFWFDYFADSVPHHLLSTEVADVPGLTAAQRDLLRDRIMLCQRTEVLPVECIARGYLTGSGWKDYQRTGTLCGLALPSGLRNSDRLAQPLFTPSTKAASGHDENISFEEGVALLGEVRMAALRDATLDLYRRASDYALQRGIILADTKFEFGVRPGDDALLLIDEIFTPDSSRFWPADEWEPGREQYSFDKQIVRNYLEGEVQAGRWDKQPPGPTLPAAVLERSLARYREAYERLAGAPLAL